MTPLTAPSYYQLTVSAPAVARNILEYADRTATFSLAVFVLALVCLGRPRPIIDEPTRRLIVSGAAWLVGAIAPMILLPVRSDLYACLPSVGVCLAVSALCARALAQATASRRRTALLTALAVLVMLGPVFYVRTDRWVSLADGLGDARRPDPPDRPVAGRVRRRDDDDRSGRATRGRPLTRLNDAFFLTTNRRLKLD